MDASIKNPEFVPEKKAWLGPMENWEEIKKNNAHNFMIKFYLSRNIMMLFTILLCIGIMLYIYHMHTSLLQYGILCYSILSSHVCHGGGQFQHDQPCSDDYQTPRSQQPLNRTKLLSDDFEDQRHEPQYFNLLPWPLL